MRRLWVLLPLVTLLFMLQGCGFHLKGQQAISPTLANLQVAGYGQLASLIRGQIAELGRDQISSDAKHAKLYIESEGFHRTVLAVDGSGKAIEYELQYRVKFRVDQDDGKPLLASQRLDMSRTYYSSGEDELGRQDEANILKQDLVSAMADRILRQLEIQLR